LDSPVEKPATHSEDKIFNILSSIFTFSSSISPQPLSLKKREGLGGSEGPTGTIEGKDSFKVLDKPQLRDALCTKISFNPSKLVCLFSDINDTICLNTTKSSYFLVINEYFSK